jgi:hypothetical protein
MKDEDEVQVLEAERSFGLFKKVKRRSTRTRDVPNNRGRKWFRDQLGLTTVLTGISVIGGLSSETWVGLNLLSLPVTVYYARENYSVLSSDDVEDVGDEEDE